MERQPQQVKGFPSQLVISVYLGSYKIQIVIIKFVSERLEGLKSAHL